MVTPGEHGGYMGAGVHPLHLPQSPPGPIEVLLLEDSEFDAEALTRNCRRTDLPVSVTVADGFAAFRAAITRRRFDLVMLDYLLPGGDGLSAREMLRATPGNADVPTVMISNEMRYDVAVAAMKSGCMDCLAKDALGPDTLRDLVLRATQAVAGRMPDLVDAVRRVIREELAAAQLPVDVSQVQVALSSLGLMHVPERGVDWPRLLQEEETGFVFRN